MCKWIKNNEKKIIKVDSATDIGCYNFSIEAYDIVDICISGEHGTVMNKLSTKSYYIISGNGTFIIDNERYNVEAGDIISVAPKSWLRIIGDNLKSLIISNPPFNCKDEEWKETIL